VTTNDDGPHAAPDGVVPSPHRVPIEGTLDLHAFAPKDIRSVVEEYIHAAHAVGLREIRLIHGRGTGTQRGIVRQVLEHHTLVTGFSDAPDSHLGATLATLRLP
jgi:DNA-nicking Smr family endonuclease